MVFVYPLFLWALAAISLPVIIHLFNFRRYKKVYFTNVKFLKALQHESKSKSRLKELLILISRCLAIACLVLAFCQPVIPDEKSAGFKPGASAVSIYLDNSFSMENVSRQGPLLEIAKARAIELVKAAGNADKLQLITNDFEGRHQRFHSKEDIVNAIEEVKISSAVRLVSDVVSRQIEFLNTSRLSNKKIYLFSDAQKSTFNLGNIPADTLIRTTVIPLAANAVNNIFVDSCWFETPLQQKGFIQKLHAGIVNKGNSKVDAGSVKLFLNGQQVAISSFSIAAGAKTEVLFTFECKKEGFNFGSVKIEDYPVTFDDELFFAFNSKVSVLVCLVNGKGQEGENAFSSLFKADSIFKFNAFSEQMIDYNAFKTSDVVILNQLPELSTGLLSEIIKFTGKGGSMVIIPAQNANLLSYNNALTALKLPNLGSLDTAVVKTEKIETEAGFYSGVFEKIDERLNLPVVNKHFKLLTGSRTDYEPILTLQNRDNLLGMVRENNALVYLFTAPLNDKATNFNKHALFVPTFYRLSFTSLKASPLFYPVSANVLINLKNDAAAIEQPPHIKKTGAGADMIPEMRVINNSLFLYTQRQVNEPGFYQVYRNSDTLLPLAFNYSRKESDLACYTAEDLEKMIEKSGIKTLSLIADTGADLSKQILQGTEGKKLWKLFIILTILFISIEVALLRFLK
ncbi:MAG: BatA and WFA domain-containing protein [Bacteroidota bacterium]